MRGILAGCLSSILGLTLMASAALAADRPVPPPVPPLDTMHAKPVKAVFAQTFKLGTKTFRYNDTAVANLPKAVGVGAMDTLAGLTWVCFDLPSGQRVWFSGEGQLDFNTITLARNAVASSHCPALPAKFAAVVIDSDLRIGTSRSDVLKRLGQPSRQVDNWLVYSSEYAEGRIGLASQFDGDKAVFISASNWPFD